MPSQSNAICRQACSMSSKTPSRTAPLARRVELLRSITDLFLRRRRRLCRRPARAVRRRVRLPGAEHRGVGEGAAGQPPRAASRGAARIIHTLAFDDVIEVAEPVLTQSPRLDDDALIENARTKSQAHLLAISRRAHLSGAVTDVLVERGNMEVVARPPATRARNSPRPATRRWSSGLKATTNSPPRRHAREHSAAPSAEADRQGIRYRSREAQARASRTRARRSTAR